MTQHIFSSNRTVKCLTLHQPYASLVACGRKRIETRPRKLNHRGLLAIHSSRSDVFMGKCESPEFITAADEEEYLQNLPKGMVLAVCNMTGCFQFDDRFLASKDPLISLTDEERAFGDYRLGRWGYILEDVHPLKTPISTRGYQGLWDWQAPDDLDNLLEW